MADQQHKHSHITTLKTTSMLAVCYMKDGVFDFALERMNSNLRWKLAAWAQKQHTMSKNTSQYTNRASRETVAAPLGIIAEQKWSVPAYFAGSINLTIFVTEALPDRNRFLRTHNTAGTYA